MDVIEKIFKELFDKSTEFVGLCLNGNKDFNDLSEDVQSIVKALCISIITTWEMVKLGTAVSKTDFFKK